jgi:hypothetical protein
MMDKVLNFAFARVTLSQYYCSESWMVSGVVVGLNLWHPDGAAAAVLQVFLLMCLAELVSPSEFRDFRTSRWSRREVRVFVSCLWHRVIGVYRRCSPCSWATIMA